MKRAYIKIVLSRNINFLFADESLELQNLEFRNPTCLIKNQKLTSNIAWVEIISIIKKVQGCEIYVVLKNCDRD